MNREEKGDAQDAEKRGFRAAWHTRAKVESVVEGRRAGGCRKAGQEGQDATHIY